MNIVGEDIFLDLLKSTGSRQKGSESQVFKEGIEKLNKIKEIYFDIIKNKQCFKLKDLAINGNDLISLGFKEGKEIGNILHALLDIVIENPLLNEKKAFRNCP